MEAAESGARLVPIEQRCIDALFDVKRVRRLVSGGRGREGDEYTYNFIIPQTLLTDTHLSLCTACLTEGEGESLVFIAAIAFLGMHFHDFLLSPGTGENSPVLLV
jgi:hypothetical protein